MKKVIGFLGSPRRGGNSEILLDCALKGAQNAGAESRKIIVSELKIAPCAACYACQADGICVIKDDFQEIHRLLREENLFLFAFPLYFMSMPAQLKALIDRAQCCWAAKYLLKKPVAPLTPGRKCSAIMLRGMTGLNSFTCPRETLKAFCVVNNIHYHDELGVQETDKLKLVADFPELLQKAEQLGKELLD